MTAREAAEFVAQFIDCSFPSNKSKIYDILELAVDKAWAEGRWYGMTVEGSAPSYTQEDGRKYFLSPKSHPILLAINVDGVPTNIRDKQFVFHKNGNGSMKNYPGCNWNTDVYDIGDIPSFNKLNIKFPDGMMIGVRSLGQSGSSESVMINGTHMDGEKVYTYTKTEYGKPCGCSIESKVETIQGIKIDINANFNYIRNIKFEDILSIEKTVTRSPVEIIAIDSIGNGHVIARLEPNETSSKYRKYLISNNQSNKSSIHGLFKIAKQGKITSDSQKLIIDNKEAIIALCMGINLFYYKNQLEFGSQMILQGITILEKEKRETESPNQFPIQVDNDLSQLPETLQNIS